jgi:hypothetical protein
VATVLMWRESSDVVAVRHVGGGGYLSDGGDRGANKLV